MKRSGRAAKEIEGAEGKGYFIFKARWQDTMSTITAIHPNIA